MILLKRIFIYIILSHFIYAQGYYNHPEINWRTFETDNFQIHFYESTEGTAREGAFVAEKIYPFIINLYEYKPEQKTDIIFLDTDDISNGAAYYYDNKIFIWASPMDFELRGSHRWLQNVITHEFAHIVSMQKSMKAGLRFPGAYVQWLGYEEEKRKDVLYGYPNRLMSYAIPGTVVPPWLAEGTAQFMYDDADWDNWDTHRDMILRDRTINNNLLSFTEMNTFGKSGIGNESTYNSGYKLCRFIALSYGSEKLKEILINLSSPLQFSVNNAIKKSIGITGEELYEEYKKSLSKGYNLLTKNIKLHISSPNIIVDKGSANLHPAWSPNGNQIAFISNADNDFFSQTDLFIYDMDKNKKESVQKNVVSTPSWNSNGTVIYYSKRAKYPNRHGSKYYDIYEYNINDKKENRLTVDSRGFAPCFIPLDSSLAYLATYDGGQNIYLIDLKSRKTQKITNFSDRRIISNLSFDDENNRLMFDMTRNHFRDIAYLSLEDSVIGYLFENKEWDERDVDISSGKIIYSDDRSGVFNLYMIDKETMNGGYITNVMGGAFMPDVNKFGQVVYSHYENGSYKIAVIDTIDYFDQLQVGYNSDYWQRNVDLTAPMNDQILTADKTYHDDFTNMFISPKVMFDYNTLKLGWYFYSNEIIDRLNIFGGASVNASKDLDLFYIFEFKRFFPTVFAEVYYLTRNLQEKNKYSVYTLDDRLRFRLTQFDFGLRFPLFGLGKLELFSSWQQYRAFIKEKVLDISGLEAGLAYDYYKGLISGMRLSVNGVKRLIDSNINPSSGFKLDASVLYEKNDFIEGLNLSDAGTLLPNYSNNNLWRIKQSSSLYLTIPKTKRITINLESITGMITNTEADSFFNFFAGGLNGLRGYPFYSIEGNSMALFSSTLRVPIFREKHIPLGWLIIQNSTLGIIGQIGDAWDKKTENPGWNRSAGIQLRISGFSFYNFPTAIGLEFHRGFDTFERKIENKMVTYGNDQRFYLTVLFGF
jgi:Tol biopolymer transport system component